MNVRHQTREVAVIPAITMKVDITVTARLAID